MFYDLVQDKNWEFATTPFEDFNATKEQLFQAFVHWSRKSGDDGEAATTYNPSKALRCLEAYVEWMDKNCQDMNLKGSTMVEIAEKLKTKITHDKKGRLVWWFDIGGLVLKDIKKNVPPEDTLRFFVWMSHLVLFDKGSQENGFVFVEAFGRNTGMMEMFTVVTMDLSTKLDRLTIGILPVKMEKCFIYDNPTWIRVMMALLSPFLTKKMKQRIVSIPNKANPMEFLEEEVGKDNIPVGVTHLEGTVEKDLVAQTLERLTSVITDEVET
ncbi:unknown protein [Seminavis robusta]|uniref:CRAL-TRIO domain-containing protein n=1 Tax=Seminavis robusta TaxID=568900 RepID=A0A9N8F268_9STRA|nr:unknown protein [Seminavis robusta]|eukprot:Sro2445_g327860.1 n/a (269) ;mRNA; f:663-1621